MPASRLATTCCTAYAVNDLGPVVGWAHTASEATHAFLFTGGTMTDLGTFGLDPVPEAINNHGVIVVPALQTNAPLPDTPGSRP